MTWASAQGGAVAPRGHASGRVTCGPGGRRGGARAEPSEREGDRWPEGFPECTASWLRRAHARVCVCVCVCQGRRDRGKEEESEGENRIQIQHLKAFLEGEGMHPSLKHCNSAEEPEQRLLDKQVSSERNFIEKEKINIGLAWEAS